MPPPVDVPYRFPDESIKTPAAGPIPIRPSGERVQYGQGLRVSDLGENREREAEEKDDATKSVAHSKFLLVHKVQTRE